MTKSFFEYLKEAKKVKQRTFADWWDEHHNEHLSSNNDLDEVSSSLSKGRKLEPKHEEAIEQYTSNYNKPLNKTLIEKKPLSTKHQKIANDLDDAIAKNPFRKKATVYSRLSFDPREHVDKKSIMSSPAYLSTTHSKMEAASFSSSVQNPKTKKKEWHFMQLRLKPGDPAVHIGDKSVQPDERETLVGRNTRLRLHKTETFKDTDGITKHIHHMEIHNE